MLNLNRDVDKKQWHKAKEEQRNVSFQHTHTNISMQNQEANDVLMKETKAPGRSQI